MIRSQLPADKKEYYFLCRQVSEHYIQLIEISSNKDYIFDKLKSLESQGVACYVEDSEGKRLS